MPCNPRTWLAAGVATAAVAWPTPSPVHADSVDRIVSVEVEHERGRYTLESVSHFAAPPQSVFAVLADYDGFARISGAIREARELPPGGDGRPRVYTLVRGCVLFFCRSIERVETLQTEPYSRIVTRVVPDHSDADYGETRWLFFPDGGGTRVELQMVMEPGFWVPPLIGPALVKRRLQRDGENAVVNIGALARAHAAANADDD